MEYAERSMWTVLNDALSLSASLRRSANHPARLRTAGAKGVAIWDVLSNVHVRGGGGERGPEVPNDVTGLLENHPSITRVCFIGIKAKQAFVRHHRDQCAADGSTFILEATTTGVQHGGQKEQSRTVELVLLPSSSTGNSRVTHEQKVKEWTKCLMLGSGGGGSGGGSSGGGLHHSGGVMKQVI